MLRAVEEVGPKCGLGAQAGRLSRVRRANPHVSIWIHNGRSKLRPSGEFGIWRARELCTWP